MFKRVLKFAWQAFLRNKVFGLEIILSMIIALYLITFLFLVQGLTDFLIETFENKVDISIYFEEGVSEDNILEIEKGLYQFAQEIESVEYVTAEEALRRFIDIHRDDEILMGSLEELGDNPFRASLEIKAQDPTYYETISDYFDQEIYKDYVGKVSYVQNKELIERITALSDRLKTAVIIISFIFALMAGLITFSTIKLAIFNSRAEISTMRVVGASNWLIRGPFIFQGLLYGFIAVAAVDVVFLIMLYLLNARLATFTSGFSVFTYFLAHFPTVILVQILFTSFLGVVSTCLAIRKYLKI
jgi:cell division transport system permease protein